jgi:DHA2 family multidrug resistance protein
LAELKPWEIPEGTGMFNLTRQLGGSLGIAIVATLLSRFTFQAKSQLTQHVVTIGTDAQARLDFITRGMVARGINPTVARQEALMVMDRMVTAQASVLAFSRIYLISGVALCCAVPLMLFWRHGRSRAAVQAH